MVIVPALLVAAAFFDLTTYRIPNLLPAVMVAAFRRVHADARLWRSRDELERDRAALLRRLDRIVPGHGHVRRRLGRRRRCQAVCGDLLWLGWDALYDYVILACCWAERSRSGSSCCAAFLCRRCLRKLPWFARLADPALGRALRRRARARRASRAAEHATCFDSRPLAERSAFQRGQSRRFSRCH